MKHSLISRRSEFGIAKPRFARCSLKAWLIISTHVNTKARACACQPLPRFFPCSATLLQIILVKRHQMVALHPGC